GVAVHLLDQGGGRGERTDVAEAGAELDADDAAVQITVPVEQVELDGGREALEGGPGAEMEQTGNAFAVVEDSVDRVDSLERHHLLGVADVYVRGGEAEAATALHPL